MFDARPETSGGRVSKHILTFSALLLMTASCGDCSCNKTTTTDPMTNSGKEVDAPKAPDFEAYNAKVIAIVRAQNLPLIDAHSELYLAPPETPKEAEVKFSFTEQIPSYLRDKLGDEFRPSGNVDWVYTRPEKKSENAGWTIAIPVKSFDAALAKLGAPAEKEVTFQRFDLPAETLYVQPTRYELGRGQISETGDMIVVSNSQEGAQLAQKLVSKYATEQTDHLHVHFWPSRLGLLERWQGHGQLLFERLAASGHSLMPARASMVSLESMLLRELGEPSNWPEPLHLEASYKIREKRPKLVRARLHVPIRQEAEWETLHKALQPRKGGTPPNLEAGSLATMRLRIDRSELDEVFDVVFPQKYLYILAASGEQQVAILRGLVSDVLDHNRGPTTVALFSQGYPLSGDVFIGFEAMDIERLPDAALAFNENFIKKFWAPLHLTDVSEMKVEEFKGEDGFVAQALKFKPSTENEDVDLGICWQIKDGYYLSYFGQQPCMALQKSVPESFSDQQPPAFEVDFSFHHFMETFYLPPGQKFTGKINSGSALARMKVAGYAKEAQGQKFFELEGQFKQSSILRALLLNRETLAQTWDESEVIDLSEILGRLSTEQAIYQEPALSIIGPPGMLGGAPPAMYMGLPFSLPPAPPSQLKEAVLGTEDEETPKKK